jgi:predicted transposase YdaD
LDELPSELAEQSLELGVLQLIGLDDDLTPARARQLVARVRDEVTAGAERERVVELVLATLVYKFPTFEREAIRQMLGLDELKQTRFYQEMAEEERTEERERVLARAIPSFLRLGLSAEQIAQELDVEVATVECIRRQQQEQN